MKIDVVVGDVLRTPADVLASTANTWLNLSGGVNGAVREATGSVVQGELHEHLRCRGLSAVPAGTVVRSGAGGLPFEHILHAVAIDPFYDSSIELVGRTVAEVWTRAEQLGAKSVAMPTLATGYGPLSIGDFAAAARPLLQEDNDQRDRRRWNLSVTVVVRNEDERDRLRGGWSVDRRDWS